MRNRRIYPKPSYCKVRCSSLVPTSLFWIYSMQWKIGYSGTFFFFCISLLTVRQWNTKFKRKRNPSLNKQAPIRLQLAPVMAPSSSLVFFYGTVYLKLSKRQLILTGMPMPTLLNVPQASPKYSKLTLRSSLSQAPHTSSEGAIFLLEATHNYFQKQLFLMPCRNQHNPHIR